MTIAKITGQGLLAIAFSVALLWICLIVNAALSRQAYSERLHLLKELRRPDRNIPASTPLRSRPHVKMVAG